MMAFGQTETSPMKTTHHVAVIVGRLGKESWVKNNAVA
jgi:hypothetical protein